MKQRIFFSGLLPLLLLLSSAVDGHNITHILAGHPDFSTFSHYLTVTHLAAEINHRRTITVCAVDNAAMNDLLAKHFSLDTVKNILSLHVFADYFGAKKLHQVAKGSTTTSSLFQATGEAAGTSGYVNITDMRGGKVGFTPIDSGTDNQPMATFVKTIIEEPYVISVIQISHVLSSPEAEAPTGSPTDINVTSLMANQGCKAFSDLIIAHGNEDTFTQNLETGLTIFCPKDDALNSFMPSFKNLTDDDKTSLILFHAISYYNSLGMLRAGNGLMNTLATEGAKKFDFTIQNDGDDVKIETKVVTATISGTLIDRDPLAVFKVDKVLLPTELFKAAPASPAPKPSKSKKAVGAEAPGPSDDDTAAADEDSSNDGGRIISGGGSISVCFALFVGILTLVF